MFRSHWYDKARKSEEQEAVESSGEMVEEQFVVAHKEQMVSTPQTLSERKSRNRRTRQMVKNGLEMSLV